MSELEKKAKTLEEWTKEAQVCLDKGFSFKVGEVYSVRLVLLGDVQRIMAWIEQIRDWFKRRPSVSKDCSEIDHVMWFVDADEYQRWVDEGKKLFEEGEQKK